MLVFGSVLIGNLLYLPMDYQLGADVFLAGLVLRLGPVSVFHAAAIAAILLNWPRPVRFILMVAAQVSLVATVAYLGRLAEPPIQDRYFMVVGMLAVLANLMLPRRPLTSVTSSALSVLSLAFIIVPGDGRGLDELAMYLSLLIITSLVAAIRAELSARRAFLLRLSGEVGAEELRKANEQLHQLTRTDPLTGLLNRRGLDEALEKCRQKAQEKGSRLAVLMIDIDRFKLLNDSLGHEAGDACLVAVAEAIRTQRDSDGDMVAARYGGEEFAVILPDADPVAARDAAEELRFRIEKLALPNPGAEAKVVTISVGVAAMRGHAQAVSPLELADEALFQAKNGGRNRVAFALPLAA